MSPIAIAKRRHHLSAAVLTRSRLLSQTRVTSEIRRSLHRRNLRVKRIEKPPATRAAWKRSKRTLDNCQIVMKLVHFSVACRFLPKSANCAVKSKQCYKTVCLYLSKLRWVSTFVVDSIQNFMPNSTCVQVVKGDEAAELRSCKLHFAVKSSQIV